jgi:hypothetical protein
MSKKHSYTEKFRAQSFCIENEAYFLKLFAADNDDFTSTKELCEKYKMNFGVVISEERTGKMINRLYNHDLWRSIGMAMIEKDVREGQEYWLFDQVMFLLVNSEAFNQL